MKIRRVLFEAEEGPLGRLSTSGAARSGPGGAVAGGSRIVGTHRGRQSRAAPSCHRTELVTAWLHAL